MQPIDLAYEVCNLQPSREGALPKNEEPNNVLNIDQHEYLKFHHPEDAFAKNLRERPSENHAEWSTDHLPDSLHIWHTYAP